MEEAADEAMFGWMMCRREGQAVSLGKEMVSEESDQWSEGQAAGSSVG